MSVTCDFCGQQWERHPAEFVECPECFVPAHSRCKRPSGHEAMEPHASRESLALRRGVLSMRPEGEEQKKKETGDQLPLFG